MSYKSVNEIINESIHLRNARVFYRDFANVPELNPDNGPQISFTRSTSATFTNASGQIATAAINVPRFEYDPLTKLCRGLLIEESRTNILLRSEEFDNASWGKINLTVGADATAAPTGTTVADSITATATDACRLTQNVTITNAINYTMSCYFKQGTADAFMRWQTASTLQQFKLNLTTGVVTAGSNSGNTATTTLVQQANGWWRATLTVLSDATSATAIFGVWTPAETDKFGYPGSTTGHLCYIWGAQVEVGAFVTTYIPTVSAGVNRTQDFPLINPTNFGYFYNPGAGTFFVEGRGGLESGQGGYGRFLGWDGAAGLSRNGSSNINSWNNVVGITITGPDPALNVIRACVGYTSNTLRKLAYAGSNVATSATTIGTFAGGLGLGYSLGLSNPLNGFLSRVAYYNVLLSDNNFIQLTR